MMNVFQLVVSVIIVLWSVSHVQCCFRHCTIEFKQALTAAYSGPSAFQLTCLAITKHIQCLQLARSNCDQAFLRSLETTLIGLQTNYDRTCRGGTTATNMAVCSSQYILCSEKFNGTFFRALDRLDITKACQSLNNYTTCVEKMVTPECGQYATPVLTSVQNLQLKYGSGCQGDTAVMGANIQLCLNKTMDCFAIFNKTFFPAVAQANIPDICRALDTYTACIKELAADVTCHQYTSQALTNIQMMKSQHNACGTDGGLKAHQCLTSFRVCYGAFNKTFHPALINFNIDQVCTSLSNYAECATGITPECKSNLRQPMLGLEILQKEYAPYCEEENRKIFSCKPLATCNKDLMMNMTIQTSFAVTSVCSMLEYYFPCVDRSLKTCVLADTGSGISFSDLGMISSRYCKTVLSDTHLTSCMDFLTCHISFNVTNFTPTMMFQGAYWCRYLESSLTCSGQLIRNDRCQATNKAEILNSIDHLEKMRTTVCEISTTVLPTTAATTSEPRETGKDKSTGGKGSSSASPSPCLTSMAVVFFTGVFLVLHL